MLFHPLASRPPSWSKPITYIGRHPAQPPATRRPPHQGGSVSCVSSYTRKSMKIGGYRRESGANLLVLSGFFLLACYHHFWRGTENSRCGRWTIGPLGSIKTEQKQMLFHPLASRPPSWSKPITYWPPSSPAQPPATRRPATMPHQGGVFPA